MGRLVYRIERLAGNPHTDLDAQVDFNQAAEALTEVGLTRSILLANSPDFHFEDSSKFSNNFVLALEQFRCKEALPQSFVVSWLQRFLKVKSIELSQSQIKSKVVVICKAVKNLQKRKAKAELEEYLSKSFCDTIASKSVAPKAKQSSCECKPIISQLNKNVTVLESNLKKVEEFSQSRNLIIDALRKERDALLPLRQDVQDANDTNSILSSELKALKEEMKAQALEISELKATKTYKQNCKLKSKVESQKQTIKELKEDALKVKTDAEIEVKEKDDQIQLLKNKVKTEQTVKNRYKVLNESHSMTLKDLLQCEEDKGPILKEKKFNQFSDDVRLMYIMYKLKKITSCQLQNLKTNLEELPRLKRRVRVLECQLGELSNTKLYYQRNSELRKSNEEQQRRIQLLEEKLEESEVVNAELKKQIKREQDVKHKYEKKAQALSVEKEACLHILNKEHDDEDLALKQKEDKCTMYSDQIRLLYMSLQGEANVAASQASKVVRLVAKFLFNKGLPLRDLPCPRTCLNFMHEANHIAKQHVVSKIRKSAHFTYATDGTSRNKKHYMEHHIVLDGGSTLSVGFSEVPDDKSDTLLEKSLDLFEEIADVYCQAEEETERNKTYTEILLKMKALMSDRAANMKLFNNKMLEYKKDLIGNDAGIHFLFCNAHFLIGLAEETDKAIKMKERLVEEETGTKLGRDNHGVFKNWSSDETSSSRLIRTASDVFGPRGDEKNGCREEWL